MKVKFYKWGCFTKSLDPWYIIRTRLLKIARNTSNADRGFRICFADLSLQHEHSQVWQRGFIAQIWRNGSPHCAYGHERNSPILVFVNLSLIYAFILSFLRLNTVVLRAFAVLIFVWRIQRWWHGFWNILCIVTHSVHVVSNFDLGLHVFATSLAINRE